MMAEAPAASISNWVKDKDWNKMRVLADGDRIQIFLNDHQTVDYTETDKKIAKTGVIGLQIHSGPPTEAWYRAIRIREL